MAPVSIKGPNEVVAASLASHTKSCLHGDSLPSIAHMCTPASHLHQNLIPACDSVFQLSQICNSLSVFVHVNVVSQCNRMQLAKFRLVRSARSGNRIW